MHRKIVKCLMLNHGYKTEQFHRCSDFYIHSPFGLNLLRFSAQNPEN